MQLWVTGLTMLSLCFNQWETKLTAITPCPRHFSHALRKLQLIARNSDWFTLLFAPVVINIGIITLALVLDSRLKTALLWRWLRNHCLCDWCPWREDEDTYLTKYDALSDGEHGVEIGEGLLFILLVSAHHIKLFDVVQALLFPAQADDNGIWHDCFGKPHCFIIVRSWKQEYLAVFGQLSEMEKSTFYHYSKFHLDLHTNIYRSCKTLMSRENEKAAIHDRHQFSKRKDARKRDGSFVT